MLPCVPCSAGGTVPVLLVIVVRCDHSQEYLPTYPHGRQGYWYRRCYLLEWWLTLFVKALGIDLAGRVCSPCLALPCLHPHSLTVALFAPFVPA